MGVPTDDGIWSDNDEVAAPISRESFGENPQQPITTVRLGSRLRASKNRDLMSQEEVFKYQLTLTPKEAGKNRHE